MHTESRPLHNVFCVTGLCKGCILQISQRERLTYAYTQYFISKSEMTGQCSSGSRPHSLCVIFHIACLSFQSRVANCSARVCLVVNQLQPCVVRRRISARVVFILSYIICRILGRTPTKGTTLNNLPSYLLKLFTFPWPMGGPNHAHRCDLRCPIFEVEEIQEDCISILLMHGCWVCHMQASSMV